MVSSETSCEMGENTTPICFVGGSEKHLKCSLKFAIVEMDLWLFFGRFGGAV
jgi:hypothetical protein